MNLEIKHKFVNNCNVTVGDDFLLGCIEYVKEIDCKDDLDDFVKIIVGMYQYKNVQHSELLSEFCMLLRDKIYTVLLGVGNIPENIYINLFSYFRPVSLEPDTRFNAYDSLVNTSFPAPETSDKERVYLAVLGFVVSFLNSDVDGLKKFLLRTLSLHLNEADALNFTHDIVRFLDTDGVEVSDIIDVYKFALVPKYYFSLDKTARRSFWNWGLHCFWSAKKLFNHPFWVSLYSEWKEILYTHMARNECDEAMFVHFIMYHKLLNSWQEPSEWKKYNDEVSVIASQYYKEWASSISLAQPKKEMSKIGKIKIGFLQDRLVENSPYKIQYTVWKGLLDNEAFREKYEIKVYLMCYFEKSHNDPECIAELERMGIEVWDGAAPFYRDGFYHNHLEKALFIRDQIIGDEVDILISPNNGYDISDFLTIVRCAPKQIFWCHGNFEYDVEGIDKKITHLIPNNNNADFERFITAIDQRFRDVAGARQKAKEIRQHLPQGSFVLGTIGRLVKIDSDEYMATVKSIMDKNPHTIYLACGAGNIGYFQERVRAYGLENRFVFTGHINPHVFGYVIDLWLDTFPMHQGESMSEYSSKGGVFLRLIEDREIIEILTHGHNVGDLCRDWAYSVDDYINVANYLINNQECSVKLQNENIFNALHVLKVKIQTGIQEFIDIIGKL